MKASSTEVQPFEADTSALRRVADRLVARLPLQASGDSAEGEHVRAFLAFCIFGRLAKMIYTDLFDHDD